MKLTHGMFRKNPRGRKLGALCNFMLMLDMPQLIYTSSYKSIQQHYCPSYSQEHWGDMLGWNQAIAAKKCTKDVHFLLQSYILPRGIHGSPQFHHYPLFNPNFPYYTTRILLPADWTICYFLNIMSLYPCSCVSFVSCLKTTSSSNPTCQNPTDL